MKLKYLEQKDAEKDQELVEHIDVSFELKTLEDKADSEFFLFTGLASTFGNIDKVDDIVMKGAFQESIAKALPVILFMHKRDMPVGMPLEIRETDEGLFIKGKLPKKDTFVSGRLVPQMKVGSIGTMSIGFITRKSSFDEVTGIRTLLEVDLKEVSLVVTGFEANSSAVVESVKIESITVDVVKKLTVRQLEKTLRESGAFSNDAATYLASKMAEQGEPVPDGFKEASEQISEMVNKLDVKADNPSTIESLAGDLDSLVEQLGGRHA